ncbi:MAG: GGDEF domain-containing protein [Candidatus Gastranaerophilales bacterium]|nr:GGDEF domain-containing protein [Candidatus Gastranaerophilales bacterium]
MKSSFDLQNISQQQITSEKKNHVPFKASVINSDTAEFSTKKQSSDRIIALASIGTAIAATIACVKSTMQLSKIEKKFAGNLKDMGIDFISKEKSRFKRIIEMEERFFGLSAKDTMTGLNNRGYLYANLPKIIEKAKLNNENIIIAMVDLDHFKSINTAFDHNGGDSHLKRVSEIMKEVFSEESELIARYGGEEFVIITKDAHKLKLLTDRIKTDTKLLETVPSYIDNLTKLMKSDGVSSSDKIKYEEYLAHIRDQKGHTASVGFVNVKDNPEFKPDDYVEIADKALNRKKNINQRGEITKADSADFKNFYDDKIIKLTEQNIKNPSAKNQAKIDELQEKMSQIESKISSSN